MSKLDALVRARPNDFVKYDKSMAHTFHTWEVMMPFGPKGQLRFRHEKFTPEEYETPEEQYEAVCDLIRGCKFSDSEYYVYCDDKLVVNF